VPLINPFRREDETSLLSQRTHNHRRWSHVFPPGEVEFKHSPGPNWKSLCQPVCIHTHTHTHIYITACVCVCVCVYLCMCVCV
jgi:hypothetical protein